jgi:ribose-phosphate pyrophosphokinase
MDEHDRGKLGIVACNSGMHFAKKVDAELLKIMNGKAPHDVTFIRKSEETHFANTEVKTKIEESIRFQDIYVFQDLQNLLTPLGKNGKTMSVNDNFMALVTAIDTAKKADAHYVTAVIPSFPYARQDRRKGRECLTSKLIASFLEASGVNRVITLDVHNDAIEGFFSQNVKFENLRASVCMMDYVLANHMSDNLVICAPDTGGADRTNYYAQRLNRKLVMIYKERDYSIPNAIAQVKLLGDVKGKDVLVIDDLIDTAGTLISGAEELKRMGARNIYFAASLALLNPPAVERLTDAYKRGIISKVIGTNVIYHSDDFKKNNPWYDEVHLEKYFAEVIHNINTGKSISELLK